MRDIRIYQNIPLEINQTLELDGEATHHLLHVIKISESEPIIIFNGKGGEFLASIIHIHKNSITVKLDKFFDMNRESPLYIHLAQAVSRGDKMDFTIQKSVELGVNEITPLITDFCNVKLSADRWQKKIEHWEKIIIHACEQCGRNIIPKINPVIDYSDWITTVQTKTKLVLHHRTNQSLSKLNQPISDVTLLIGPEGGLSENEINLAKTNGFDEVKLGPRVLRTETAALAMTAALQEKFGDYY